MIQLRWNLICLLAVFIIGCAHNMNSQFNDGEAGGREMPQSAPMDLPPDSRCSLYQGTQCVAPISRAPDASCAFYDGDFCVSPMIE